MIHRLLVERCAEDRSKARHRPAIIVGKSWLTPG